MEETQQSRHETKHSTQFFFHFGMKSFLHLYFVTQLIIITGSSYEALATEGIQLNMSGGNIEEVTCTVIGGVNYDQVCPHDSGIKPAEDEDSVTGG